MTYFTNKELIVISLTVAFIPSSNTAARLISYNEFVWWLPTLIFGLTFILMIASFASLKLIYYINDLICDIKKIDDFNGNIINVEEVKD